jgi:hypothetical protein
MDLRIAPQSRQGTSWKAGEWVGSTFGSNANTSKAAAATGRIRKRIEVIRSVCLLDRCGAEFGRTHHARTPTDTAVGCELPPGVDVGRADTSLIAWRYLGPGIGASSGFSPYRGQACA